MTNLNIKQELSNFHWAAERGYELAVENCNKIETSLNNAEKNITEANAKKNQLQHVQNIELLSNQNEEIQAFRKNLEEIRKNIDMLHQQAKDFSIALFGRKMAGKSTLLEILTNSELNTNSAPHAVKDIRSYYWNGLKITDVPSFEFFDSEEKNQRGLEVAKSADLVIFLLTTETPTVEEAQCLAQLKSLGKSILGVVNVKKNLTFETREQTLKDLYEIFSDTEAIDTVVANFKENAQNFHQNWNDIKFVPVHLAAVAKSISKEKFDEEIYEAGNFAEVKNFILEKVNADGKFLVFKNFVDTAAVPMNNLLLKLFEHSVNSLKESKIWTDKSKKILTWRNEFWQRSQKKLYALFDELTENLKTEIPKFADENHDAQNFNEKWSEFFKSLGYAERYQELIETFSDEYKGEMQKFNDELAQELTFNLNSNTDENFKVRKSNTMKKYLAAVAPNLLVLVPGINLGAILAMTVGSSIINFLIDKTKYKIPSVRQKLITKLEESGFETLNNISEQAHDILNRQIFVSVEDFSNTLLNCAHMLARLGESQSKLAESIIYEYSELNTRLFIEAINYKEAGKFSDIRVTMRIPGTISVVISEDSQVNTREMSSILNERFFILRPLEDWNATIKKLLGCEFEKNYYALDENIEEQTYSITAHGKVSTKRLKLAQQLSPYPIITQ